MWLCWQQEETRFQHFSKMANLTQLHHRKNPVGTWNFDMKQELYWSTSFAVFCVKIFLAYVASVSVRFYRSKERGTRVEDRAKNGASKRAGRGWVRKEGNACRQTPRFWKQPTWPVTPEFTHRNLMLSSAVIIDQ